MKTTVFLLSIVSPYLSVPDYRKERLELAASVEKWNVRVSQCGSSNNRMTVADLTQHLYRVTHSAPTVLQVCATVIPF